MRFMEWLFGRRGPPNDCTACDQSCDDDDNIANDDCDTHQRYAAEDRRIADLRRSIERSESILQASIDGAREQRNQR